MRDDRHWQKENYKQRMTVGEWKHILIAGDDKIIFHGKLRQLKAKRLNYGMVEVYKEVKDKKQ